MARGRVYKSEVKAARDALLREGTNPSLDAVRIALGNTGSKTTIHRLMRELEAEEAATTVSAGERISDALQTLVQQLAAQLRQEADATVASVRQDAEAQVAAARADTAALAQQLQASSEQVQRLQTSLDTTRQTLAATEQSLREHDTAIVGLRERLGGLQRQLDEREVHLASVETKHQQARDALEHFRQAAKEQRDTEARQHEQAVQALQVELRRATDAVAAKNDDLLVLNRDNARLTQELGQCDRDLREARRVLLAAEERAGEADALRQSNHTLEARLSQAMADGEALRRELVEARAGWDTERAALREGVQEARAQAERWGTIETLLTRLQPRAETAPGAAPSA
ncbi:DNA-binding protein [Luteibacter sp. CQ10]|uniref:DNA-binding protein n=1 Tax=Luteibacter sp. CQ10 TaxID=2805821 RepID=UPI0034A4A0FA